MNADERRLKWKQQALAEELADVAAYDATRPQVLAELRRGDFLTIQEFLVRHPISKPTKSAGNVARPS
jgi:hypothetical protein